MMKCARHKFLWKCRAKGIAIEQGTVRSRQRRIRLTENYEIEEREEKTENRLKDYNKQRRWRGGGWCGWAQGTNVEDQGVLLWSERGGNIFVLSSLQCRSAPLPTPYPTPFQIT
jgi:hypothetical protein